VKAPRKPVRTKRTASGKIMGRPVKRSGVGLPHIEPKAPRLKRYLKRYREPGRMICPTTGEIVERFGPSKPVYEWSEPKIGRPRMKDGTAILHIVEAEKYRGQRGGAWELAERGAGNSPSAVKRRLTRTRKQIRRRKDDLSNG
jgi:hypothetical protein